LKVCDTGEKHGGVKRICLQNQASIQSTTFCIQKQSNFDEIFLFFKNLYS